MPEEFNLKLFHLVSSLTWVSEGKERSIFFTVEGWPAGVIRSNFRTLSQSFSTWERGQKLDPKIYTHCDNHFIKRCPITHILLSVGSTRLCARFKGCLLSARVKRFSESRQQRPWALRNWMQFCRSSVSILSVILGAYRITFKLNKPENSTLLRWRNTEEIIISYTVEPR